MYLLSTQTLMDLLCGVPEVKEFADEVHRAGVYLSVVTLGQVEQEIRATSLKDGRDQLDRYFRRVLSMARTQSTVEPFGESAASIWAQLGSHDLMVDDDGIRPISDIERMVVATALDRKLVLVEQAQPYHRMIPELKVVDPYAA
jgi:predicted nucleic acid-binding protein